MPFQTPITVAKVLDKIDRREYVLLLSSASSSGTRTRSVVSSIA